MSPKKAISILFILAALIGGFFYFFYIKNLKTEILSGDGDDDDKIVQQEPEIKKTPAQIQEENEAKRAEMIKVLESLNVQDSSEASTTGASTTASSTIISTVTKPAEVVPASPNQETPEMKAKREEMIKILESLNAQK